MIIIVCIVLMNGCRFIFICSDDHCFRFEIRMENISFKGVCKPALSLIFRLFVKNVSFVLFSIAIRLFAIYKHTLFYNWMIYYDETFYDALHRMQFNMNWIITFILNQTFTFSFPSKCGRLNLILHVFPKIYNKNHDSCTLFNSSLYLHWKYKQMRNCLFYLLSCCYRLIYYRDIRPYVSTTSSELILIV